MNVWSFREPTTHCYLVWLLFTLPDRFREKQTHSTLPVGALSLNRGSLSLYLKSLTFLLLLNY